MSTALAGVRTEMKRMNDIITSVIDMQERTATIDSMFMALQFLPKEIYEYKTILQKITSIGIGQPLDENSCNNLFYTITGCI